MQHRSPEAIDNVLSDTRESAGPLMALIQSFLAFHVIQHFKEKHA